MKDPSNNAPLGVKFCDMDPGQVYEDAYGNICVKVQAEAKEPNCVIIVAASNSLYRDGDCCFEEAKAWASPVVVSEVLSTR